ncbi:hypothetical protein NECAME_13030 [Necator americanus]|uniref:Uncharacterized protein n=1 Tax=Necator americanus TaxID=51031 RepID=W2SXU1_NECAM|nr:hypothetical protein NECAME_13030 [Necator americanus]ETN74343.1 hypothetical protein NECAME_13030 [Necator americanus]
MPPTFYSMEIVIVICFATMTDFATSSNTTATNSDSTTMEPTRTASSTGTSSTSSTSSTTMSSVSTTSSTGTSSTSTTSSTKTSPTSTTLSTDTSSMSPTSSTTTSSMSPTSSTTTSPMSPTSSTTTSMNTTTSTASFSTVLPTVTTLTDTTSSIVMSTGPTLQTISLTSTALFNTTHQISVTTKGWNATAILERSVTNYRDNYDKIELPYVPPLKIEELLNKCVHPKFLLNTTFEATLDRKYLESCVAKNPTLGRFSSHAIGDEQNLEPESSHMQIFRKVPGISEFALSTIIVLWTILCMKILFELLHVTCVVLLNMEAEEEQEL